MEHKPFWNGKSPEQDDLYYFLRHEIQTEVSRAYSGIDRKIVRLEAELIIHRIINILLIAANIATAITLIVR